MKTGVRSGKARAGGTRLAKGTFHAQHESPFDASPGALFTLDGAGRFLAANAACQAVLGYSPAELLRKRFTEVCAVDRLAATKASLRRALAGQAEPVIATAARHPDGRRVEIRVTCEPVVVQGKFEILCCTARRASDLARRQPTEEALRRSEEGLRILAASTPDHLLVQDRNLRYTLVVNPQLGLTEAEMLGKTDYDILLKAEADRLTRLKRRVMKTGRTIHMEMPATSKTGELEYFEGDYVPKYDPQGRIDGLIGYFRNVTARKRTEKALRESEEKYRALFESSRDAIVIHDLEGRTLDCNAAALRMLGSGAKEEFLKKTLAGFSPGRQPDGQDSRTAVRRRIQEAVAKGTAYFEWQYQRQDGTVFPAAVLLSRFQLGGRPVIQAAVHDITDQKAALAALLESEALLEEVGHLAQMGGWEFDAATGAVKWTDELARIHDLPAGTKMSVKAGLRFYQGESRRKMEAAVREAIEQAKPYDLELEIVTARRKRKWVRILGHPVVEDGKVVKVHGFFQDLTARKRDEELLRGNEQRLRMALEAATMVTWEWDIPGDRIRYSANTAEVARGDALEPYRSVKGLMQQVHPEDRAVLRQAIQRTIRQGDPYNCEYRVKMLDGAYRWIFGKGNVVEQKGGKPVRVAGISQDITERKETEEALRASEARLRAFLENSAVIAWLKDEKGRYVFLSKNYERRFGVRLQDWRGKTDFDLWPREIAKEFRGNDQAVLAADKPLEVIEYTADRKGNRTWWLNHKFTFRGAAGRRYVGGLGVDITERQRLERELLEVGERERLRLGHDLHDGLGQQLHALHYIGAMLAGELAKDSPGHAAQASLLARELQRGLEMTRGLARGLQPVAAVPEGLMAALHDLAARTRQLYRVDCRFGCGQRVLVPRHSAANHLYRIAQEAVNNALKHGKASRIVIKLVATPGKVVLGIRDNGRGISRRRARSKGMGLHIMQFRAGAIGGSLAVQRHPEGGTEVVCSVSRGGLLPQPEDPQ